MEKLIATVQGNPLLANVSGETLRSAIVPRGSTKTYAAGSNLFLPLDRVSRVNILLSGKVKLVYYMENGEQDIRNLIFPPKLIGADLICTRTQLSPYQATAVEQSAVFSFPAEIILQQGSMPEPERLTCINNLLQILSNVNMQNEYRLAILTRSGLRERILVYLTMQANKAQSNTFRISFSREEMASFLRVNRSALSHELSLLRQEGIIEFHKNEFTLLTCYDAAVVPE
ncbi:MAG: Crp/Fnr family transcriptional regulator [Oscillospiraceae bacterium]|nr:Crp/Fnr family transcriptional regulator [Oscillospiraceae bacterium]